MILAIGSYTDSLPHVQAKGSGITLLNLDGCTGALSPIGTFSGVRNPTYLAISIDKQMLYAVEELSREDGAAVVALNLNLGGGSMSLAARVPAHGDCPCHICVDRQNKRLFVSNYVSGNLVTYELDERGVPTGRFVDTQRTGSGPLTERQEGPHVHQAVVAPDGRHLLVCDLGTDEIARHRIGETLLDPVPDLVAKVGNGSLPRHLVFSPNGRYVHVIHEGANIVTSHAYGASQINYLSEVSLLPLDFLGASAAAAIRIHPQGRFVYASNRGHDSISAFALSEDESTLQPIGTFRTGGHAPRDFAIDPTGRWLIAANQNSHSLTVFAIDLLSGELSTVGEPYLIGSPVCVLFAGI